MRVHVATPTQSKAQHVPTTQLVSTPPKEEEPQVMHMVDLSKVPDGTLGKECINFLSIMSFSHYR